MKELIELTEDGMNIMLDKLKEMWGDFSFILESLPRFIYYAAYFIMGFVIGSW
tara:strand:- start:439 stop:597 length:159 start_codon:yes stop_codon:yes gene_type:complete